MKRILSNFKQGIKIGILGTALAAGAVMGTGCEMPNGGNTNTNKYGTPYDKEIGNGYILHNFISDDDNFDLSTYVDDVQHYLALGETYIKGNVDKFNQSLNGRTAQNYFAEFVNTMKNNDNFKLNSVNPGDYTIDLGVNTISFASEPIFQDIVQNIDGIPNREAFYCIYRLLANEAYKEGLGSYRQYSSTQMNEYEYEKDFINLLWGAVETEDDAFKSIDLNEVYNTNNFSPITQFSDRLLEEAANSINQKQGYDITAADLRAVVNLNLTSHALRGMHARVRNNLKHNNCVILGNYVANAMDKVMYNTNTLSTQQDQELGL